MPPVLNRGFRFQGLVSILMIGLVLTPALRPHVFCAINHTACGTVLVSEVWVQLTGSIRWNLISCAIIACDRPTRLKLVARNPCVLCRDVMVNTPCGSIVISSWPLIQIILKLVQPRVQLMQMPVPKAHRRMRLLIRMITAMVHAC